MSSIKRFLCLSIFLFVGTTASNECPQHCDCTTYETYNHTKCTNLDGLRQIGKTSTIQSLDISNIGLTKLTNQLDKLTNLTQLNLSDNHLSELPRLNRRIKTLNLSHNRITSGKLSKIPQYVQHLNLSYNDITYIPLEFRKLTRLKTLELSGNPLNCSCDTLEVRNWLQEQHVWSDRSIICTSPLALKGKPWLQVKQGDICPSNTTLLDDLEDNELMLGDQPVFGDGSGEENDANGDEVENGFLPISEANIREDTVNINTDDDDGSGDDLPLEATTKGLEILFDGSGSFNTSSDNILDSGEVTSEAPDYDDEDEAEDDGSGSGGGILFIPSIAKVSEHETDDYDDSEEEVTINPERLNIFGTGITSAPSEQPDVAQEPVTEDVIKQVEAVTAGSEANNEKKNLPIMGTNEVAAPPPNVVHPEIDDSKSADTHESQGTMILLIILGIALVALLAFLIFKRKKVEGRNRRGKDDIESPKDTELADMDKNALGKPLVKNGNGKAEFAPLMGQNDIGKPNGNRLPDGEKKDNSLKDAQEPLLKKLNAPEMEAEKPKPMHDYENEKPKKESQPESRSEPKPEMATEKNNNNPQPVSPIPPYKRPNQENGHKSPVVQNGYPPDDEDDDVFQPAPVSPRPTRYSPVYSPETGRVKIRLTETPKPRTPMLVTRTRSNAGDIILTPAHRPLDLSNSQ